MSKILKLFVWPDKKVNGVPLCARATDVGGAIGYLLRGYPGVDDALWGNVYVLPGTTRVGVAVEPGNT